MWRVVYECSGWMGGWGVMSVKGGEKRLLFLSFIVCTDGLLCLCSQYLFEMLRNGLLFSLCHGNDGEEGRR